MKLSSIAGVILGALVAACAPPPVAASSLCTPDGGAQAGVPLTLTAGFGLSGCSASDAVCTAQVDGGTITFSTSASLCSTGTSPGGVSVSAKCTLPALTAGSYALKPFGTSLQVVADGGSASCP